MSRENMQLQVNPSVPGNALTQEIQATYHHPNSQRPAAYPEPTGERASWKDITQALWDVVPPSHVETRKHWLNLFLGAASRCNRVKITTALPFHEKTLEDFYQLALLHWDELNENSRSNLISHRDDFLLLVMNTSQYPNFLSENTWMSLFSEPRFSAKVRKLAEKSSHALTFYLKYCDFESLEDLNDFLRTANLNYLDFRLGRSSTDITPEVWIRFLNSLTKKNRLLFLQSEHPLNHYSWDQIARLENFTVGDALNIIKRKGRALPIAESRPTNTLEDIDDETPLIRDAATVAEEEAKKIAKREAEEAAKRAEDAFLRKSLKAYITEEDVSFSTGEFLEMRGEKISSKDFLRVICDDFSFEDFIYFVSVHKKDAPKLNGVLACFFNLLMQNPTQFLEQLDNPKKPHYKLLASLSNITSTFKEVERCARFAKEGLASNAKQQLANPDAAVVTLQGQRWYNKGKEFVITNEGSARTSALPGENYDALITSAGLLMAAKKPKEAAREYCIALSLQQKPKVLEIAYQLIFTHKITELYNVIATRIKEYIDNLLIHYNAAQNSVTDRFNMLNEALYFAEFYKTMNDDFPDDFSQHLFDKLKDIQEAIELAERTREEQAQRTGKTEQFPSYRERILVLWKKYLSLNTDNELRMDTLIQCARINTTPETKLFLATEMQKAIKGFNGKYTQNTAKKRLLLTLLIDGAQQLLNSLNSVLPEKLNEQKRFLLALPISFNAIIPFANEMSEDFSSQFGIPLSDSEKLKITMALTIIAIKNKKIDLNDVVLARKLYTEYLEERDDVLREQKEILIREWIKATKDPLVQFTLSGEEKRMENDLLQHSTSLTAKKEKLSQDEKRKKYQLILSSLAQAKNIEAIGQLVESTGLVIDDMKDHQFPNQLFLFRIILISELQLTPTIVNLLRTASQTTIDHLFVKLIENLCADFRVPYTGENPHYQRLIYFFLLSQLSSESLKKQRFQQLISSLLHKRDFDTLKVFLRNSHGEPLESAVALLDANSMIELMRQATIPHYDAEKSHFLINEMPTLFQGFTTKSSLIDFVFSGEESRLYNELSIIHLTQPQVATSIGDETRGVSQYAFLVQRMYHDKNISGLIKLYSLGASIELDDRHGNSLLPDLLIHSEHRDMDTIRCLLTLLSQHTHHLLFHNALKKHDWELSLALIDTDKNTAHQQAKYNQLLQLLIKQNQFSSAERLMTTERASWVQSDTRRLIAKKLTEHRQNDRDVTALLRLLSKSPNPQDSANEDIKFALFLLLCNQCNGHSHVHLVNMLLTQAGAPSVTISTQEARCALAVRLFNQQRETGLRSRLPEKSLTETHEDYLKKIYDHAVNHEGRNTRVTLEKLNWINEQGHSTVCSPIRFAPAPRQKSLRSFIDMMDPDVFRLE